MAAALPENRSEARHAPARRADRRWDVNMSGIERVVSLLGAGALAYLGWRRRGDTVGAGMLLLGGLLALRGATGHSVVYRSLGLAPDATGRQIAAARGWTRAARIERSVTINRPRADLYRFWRDFRNLPVFMRHLEAVAVLSDRRSHWVAKAPGGRLVEWDAEIEDERENERIAWRSVEGADIRNAGTVTFRDAPDRRGTEMRVYLSYEPPMGPLGRGVAKLFGEEPAQQLRDDLRCFKNLMEAGEIATVEGQPSGRP